MEPRGDWLAQCASWKSRYPVIPPPWPFIPNHSSSRLSTYSFTSSLLSRLPPHFNLVSGSSGSAIEIFLMTSSLSPRRRIYHTAGLGSMGFGIPAALGVCLANGQPTVCVDGDAGFMLNIQDLETIRRLNLPITFFVLNNNGYASIRASQTAHFGKPTIGCTEETGMSTPNLEHIANAYGFTYDWINTERGIEVEFMYWDPRPRIVNVLSIPDEPRIPRLVSTLLPEGSFSTPPLEDLWPNLPPEELASNMIHRTHPQSPHSVLL